MQRILILSGLQPSTNPRVVKEADTLSEAGYDVEVVGTSLDPELAAQDKLLVEHAGWKYTTLLDRRAPGVGEQLKVFAARLRTRVWREVRVHFGIESPRQLGYAAPELRSYSLRRRADLTILHNPQSLWAGVGLLEAGRRVAVDMEDWYSEDLLPQDRKQVPTTSLKLWERALLKRSRYSTTTSHSLSAALAEAYDCSPPTVLYNAFPLRERNAIDGAIRDRVDRAIPSLCWFSQVIGPGRGLETVIDAVAGVEARFEIHLRGKCDPHYRAALIERLPEQKRQRIFFHPPVPHNQLLSRLAEHDLGLATEIPFCRSRELTVTNKILQYLLAGLPVLGSDTAGQREVAMNAQGAVFLFRAENARSLADTLEGVLHNPGAMRSAGSAALASAERFFCWERVAPVLLKQVELALAESPVAGRSREATRPA